MIYKTLIISGMGAVGSALWTLGRPYFRPFEKVLLLDPDAKQLTMYQPLAGPRLKVLEGMIEDPAVLAQLMRQSMPPAILVNLGTDIDTVRLRRQLARYPVAYVDAGASALTGDPLRRISRLMPYTNQSCQGEHPHLICQGINPGMVEIVARQLMDSLAPDEGDFEISIFEKDLLHSPAMETHVPIGWSPADFVEEMLVSPSFEYVARSVVEDKRPGTRSTWVRWQGADHQARIVGHEDIWNLAQHKRVHSARFLYSLHERVTDLLEAPPDQALELLRIPEPNQVLYGSETICVIVSNRASGTTQARVWSEDHHAVWQRHGMNAVQYQTASCILFSVLLLLRTDIGRQPRTFTASNLPLNDGYMPMIEQLMAELGICWQPLAPINIPRMSAPKGATPALTTAPGRNP